MGSIGVLAAGSPYVLISLVLSLAALWLIRRRYLSTSIPLRTLQIEAQAPVVGFLRDGFQGRATVRAFGLQGTMTAAFSAEVLRAQKPAYLFRSLQTWLMLVLDLLSTVIAGSLAALVVGLKSHVSVAFAGVALVNTIVLSQDLTLLMHWWTTLESSLGVVHRVNEFASTTPKEDEGHGTETPPPAWPLAGDITLQDVSASYG